MRTRLYIAFFGSLVVALAGFAQDEISEAPPDPTPDPPADVSQQAPEDRDNEEAEDNGDEDITDIEDFIFSEEIPADEQLVFPVDI